MVQPLCAAGRSIGCARRRGERNRAVTDTWPATAVDGARRDGLVPAARDNESHLPEHRVDPAPVDRTAVDLSPELYPFLRQHALVSARPLSPCAPVRPG